MKKTILNASIVLTLAAAITQTAGALGPGYNAPDAGSTSLLLALAFGGLTVVRRFVR